VGAENGGRATDQRVQKQRTDLAVTVLNPGSMISHRSPPTPVPDPHAGAVMAGAGRPLRRKPREVGILVLRHEVSVLRRHHLHSRLTGSMRRDLEDRVEEPRGSDPGRLPRLCRDLRDARAAGRVRRRAGAATARRLARGDGLQYRQKQIRRWPACQDMLIPAVLSTGERSWWVVGEPRLRGSARAEGADQRSYWVTRFSAPTGPIRCQALYA
jgi:hypothetical protein